MQELRWESMPDRVRFVIPLSAGGFRIDRKAGASTSFSETLDGFEKKEWS